ncbi:MAG: tetratricopeptide repeat protein [Nocardioides sp.]
MSGMVMVGWSGLATVLVMAFVLGAAPVFAVRLIARLYPPGDARRAELVAEMARVCRSEGVMRQWRWLGQMFGLAACDGLAARRRARKPGQGSLQELSSHQVLSRSLIEDKLTQADLALAAGELHNARAYAEEVVRLALRTPNGDLAQQAALTLGFVAEAEGETNEAIIALEDLQAETTDGKLLAAIGLALVRCYREAGSPDQAIAVGEERLAKLSRQGLEGLDDHIRLTVNVASAYRDKGNLSQARQLCARGLEAAEQFDSIEGCAAAYWAASQMEHEAGNTSEAISLATKALAMLENGDSTRNLALLRTEIAFHHLAAPEPDLAAADALFELAGRELDWSSANRIDLACNLLGRARVRLGGGLLEEAMAFLDQVPREAEDQLPMIAVERILLTGHVHAAKPDFEAASRSYDQAHDLLVLLHDERDVAQLWFELADAHRALGQTDLAARAYRASSMMLGAKSPVWQNGRQSDTEAGVGRRPQREVGPNALIADSDP